MAFRQQERPFRSDATVLADYTLTWRWRPRLRNDLYCVGWGVKLYSLTHASDRSSCPWSRWHRTVSLWRRSANVICLTLQSGRDDSLDSKSWRRRQRRSATAVQLSQRRRPSPFSPSALSPSALYPIPPVTPIPRRHTPREAQHNRFRRMYIISACCLSVQVYFWQISSVTFYLKGERRELRIFVHIKSESVKIRGWEVRIETVKTWDVEKNNGVVMSFYITLITYMVV